MATGPLLGTFITSVVDKVVSGRIQIYFQSNDGSIMREFHDDLKRPVDVPPLDRQVARMYSPLSSIFTIARDEDIPEVRVYAQNSSDMVIEKIPKYEVILDAAVNTKFSAAYDGNSVYIQYQKTDYENEIFERNVRDGTEKSVSLDVLKGTNISTVETSIRPRPPQPPASVTPEAFSGTSGVGICRYMVYTGTDDYLWFNWIDHPEGPEIEQVQSVNPSEIWPNTPVALAPVIDILAIYFLNRSGQISRVDRGDYGWGNPKVVGRNSMRPHPGTHLAAAKDTVAVKDPAKAQRVVWVSYQDENGVITGFHDTVDGG